MSQVDTATVPACENCGTPLAGQYCHACGQRALEGGELTVRHALTTTADDVLHLESKTLRSMLLLVKPGFLTAEYLAGRRAPYTSPLKLYLAAAAIFFLLAPFAGFTLEQMLENDAAGTTRQALGPMLPSEPAARELFFERFDLRFQTVYTASLIVSVIGGAAMLALLFRRQRRPFGAHVVFELHYISFLYLATAATSWLIARLSPHPLAAPVLALAVLAPYLYLALKRVYAEPARRLVWKAITMILFAILLDSIVSFLAVLVTIRMV